ncbi:hypothetical protein AU512_15960 [Lonsdalea iberica]|uniref:Lipoprotein n=1 Tax=Lonsdalea iberica TaxID=1082703 RepID=A0ABX3XC23_9GAMM|nr:hypothetical protein [Lonsdalea iberica]OSN05016.1 hypothetical protein AU512_15960 [Lonsdalea iberica]
MMPLRAVLTVLLTANLMACAPYHYDAERNKGPINPTGHPVYTRDKNGNMTQSRRMERISQQECREYGSNCGNHFGW